jgi:sporulation protein YlmC with PRC-barrel domain
VNEKASRPAPDRTDHRFILSSRVNGTPVFDRDGNEVGHVEDLSIERVSGKTVYVIMAFGGFLGIGEKFHPIPWTLLDYDPDRAGYVVPLDKAALQAAPSYERHELVELGGPDYKNYSDRIFGYYGPHGGGPYGPGPYL